MERLTEFPREIFPHAPIVEALLDIHFEPSTPLNPDVFQQYFEAVKGSYPNKKEVRSSQSSIELSQGLPPKLVGHSDMLEACQYSSESKKQVVQIKSKGFVFNRLSPYESWEKFRPEAKRLWELFLPMIGEARIRRIGLRYINRIELPLPLQDLREYILTFPDIPPGVPQGVSDFFMRMVIPDPKKEVAAVVYHTIENPRMEKLPIIFDIDAHKVVALDINDENLWPTIELLRQYKNEIFFHSLTDKAKELFK